MPRCRSWATVLRMYSRFAPELPDARAMMSSCPSGDRAPAYLAWARLTRNVIAVTVPSPWLGIANKQLELMHKFLAELGFYPASRSRVSELPSFGPKPWESVAPNSKFAGLIGSRI